MKYSFPLFVMGCPYTDKGSRVTSGWQTAMMGSPSASSMAISVSMVKWCVPRIHLLISDSFFPRRSARSFCFRPFSFSISCILSTILKDKSTMRLISRFTFRRLAVLPGAGILDASVAEYEDFV